MERIGQLEEDCSRISHNSFCKNPHSVFDIAYANNLGRGEFLIYTGNINIITDSIVCYNLANEYSE